MRGLIAAWRDMNGWLRAWLVLLVLAGVFTLIDLAIRVLYPLVMAAALLAVLLFQSATGGGWQ